MTTFYITFQFSDKYNFIDIDAEKSLLVVDATWDYQQEGEVDAASGGTLGEWGAIRDAVAVNFWRFSRTPEDPYPNGQDILDWREFVRLWTRYRYKRISATNTVEYARFSDMTLPMPVERDFDMRSTMNDKKGYKTVSGLFLKRDREAL